MNNLLLRTITAIVFVITIVFSIIFSIHTFTLLVFALIVFGTREFYSLLERKDFKPHVTLGILTGVNILLIGLLHDYRIYLYFSLFILISTIFIFELYRKTSTLPISNIAITLFGSIYIAVPFTMFFLMSKFVF